MTYTDSPLVSSSRTWIISTTNGETMSGYLPAWAEEDPSKSDVAPDQLAVELSDITHEAAFGGQFMRVCPGAQDPGVDTAMLIALMQCIPFVGDDTETRLPLVNVQVVDDLWITDLDPSGVLEVAEKFRSFADLLVDTVAPSLSAARAEWTEHVLPAVGTR